MTRNNEPFHCLFDLLSASSLDFARIKTSMSGFWLGLHESDYKRDAAEDGAEWKGDEDVDPHVDAGRGLDDVGM